MKGERAFSFHASTFVIGVVVVVGAAFGAGFLFATHERSSGAIVGSGEPNGVDFSPVWKAWNIINEQFVPVAVASSTPYTATSTAAADQKKVYGMISGLTDALDDPYSFFLPPAQAEQFSSDISGSFTGVGMQIEVKSQVLTVVSPLKGTPAAAAGIKSGDQIVKIDGVSTQGIDTTTAVNKIRGPKGTQVTITVMRDGWDAPRDIKITRDTINVPVLQTTARQDGIFVMQLSEFTANSPELFRNALRDFYNTGDNKFILDLRGNPGGYLEAAVDIGSWFLPSGKVIVTEDYAGHADNVVHRSLGYNVFNGNLHMVILVDQGSASASEILSDALRYYGVGRLVGTNTFGKGSVQELIDITPDTSLKLTVARWLGPDGGPIPLVGIAPDVEVKIADTDIKKGVDPQVNKAVELLGGNTSLTSTGQ